MPEEKLGRGEYIRKDIDSKIDKSTRIALALRNLKEGQSLNIFELSKLAEVHSNTVTQTFDDFDILKDIGFETIRDPKGKFKLVIKRSYDTDLKEIVKRIIEIQQSLEVKKEKK